MERMRSAPETATMRPERAWIVSIHGRDRVSFAVLVPLRVRPDEQVVIRTMTPE